MRPRAQGQHIDPATLSPAERADILERYINRNTKDSPWSDYARAQVGMGRATLNDQEWIDAGAWQWRDGCIVMADSEKVRR